MLVGGFELVVDDGAEEGGELGITFAGRTVNPGERMGEVDFCHVTMMLFDPPNLAARRASGGGKPCGCYG